MLPKCCFCGTQIRPNEHYYIMRNRTVCKDCEMMIEAKKTRIEGENTWEKKDATTTA